MSNLPPAAQAELQRILDGAARRMLDEHMSGKADHTDLFEDKCEARRLRGSRPTREAS